MATFTPAHEAALLAEDIIRADHPHLLHHAVRVGFVFRDDVPKSKGKAVWGTCRKITNLPAYLAAPEEAQQDGEAEPFFVIELSKPIWDELTREQREALIDHELSHAWAEEDERTGAVKLSVLGHDVEEFAAVILRHGLWRPSLEDFARTCAEAGPGRAQASITYVQAKGAGGSETADLDDPVASERVLEHFVRETLGDARGQSGGAAAGA
jgi:Putative phage metallopeptidase